MDTTTITTTAKTPRRSRLRSRSGTKLARFLALLLALAMVAAACGSSDDSADGDDESTDAVAGQEDDDSGDDSSGDDSSGDDGSDDADEEDADAGSDGASLADDLPALAEGAAQQGGTYGGTLRVAHQFPPISLDPHTGSSGADHQTLYSMYDRLVHFKFDSLEFTPGLATSWEFTDETTLVFTLREGVTFHDGTPFNAEAVAYNVDRVQNHPKPRCLLTWPRSIRSM